MKRVQRNEDDYEYKKIKQELQIEDLKRYGIFTYLVNDYDEITEILRTLVYRYRRKKFLFQEVHLIIMVILMKMLIILFINLLMNCQKIIIIL